MVLDFFTFFNELDLLELRLSILDKYVDKFILTESHQTFSGKWKPLYYGENKERFKRWNDKIIHNVVGEFETKNPFERSFFQKEDAMKYLTDPEDMVYFGDVDEIWSPIETDEVVRLHQYNYCYFLNCRSSEDWFGTIAGKAKNMTSFNGLRANARRTVDYFGWHFTNMGGIIQILKKMDSYDHCLEVEGAKPYLIERLDKGEDYLGRGFKMTEDETNWPEYLKINRKKFNHLLK